MTELPRLPASSASGGLIRARQAAQSWINSALDLVFPPRCVHCQQPGALLCANCQLLIQPSPAVYDNAGVLSGQRATAIFDGPIQSAIHELKYKNKQRIADLLADRLIAELQTSHWTPTLVTAVPLHASRQQERGYNQSALLASRLAAINGLPFRIEVITRTRATRPQVGLNAKDRQANMADAFQTDSSLAAGQSILIVDDVYTTGATLRACASALRAAVAASVWALTVASAQQRT